MRRAAIAAAALALAAAAASVALVAGLPDVSALAREDPVSTSFLELRAAQTGVPQRLGTWTPLERISPLLVCAVIKGEDRAFFRHGAFDVGEMRKALFARGASTLTQQLARNLYLGAEKTPWRKIREAILAHRLEQKLGKRRILELYLNVAEWGDRVWGVAAASGAIFGVEPSALDAAQAAELASRLPSPRAPGTPRARLEKQRILGRLYLSGYLDRERYLRDADPAAVPAAPVRRDPSAAEPGRALEEECGLDREMRELRSIQGARPGAVSKAM